MDLTDVTDKIQDRICKDEAGCRTPEDSLDIFVEPEQVDTHNGAGDPAADNDRDAITESKTVQDAGLLNKCCGTAALRDKDNTDNNGNEHDDG